MGYRCLRGIIGGSHPTSAAWSSPVTNAPSEEERTAPVRLTFVSDFI